jgi:putative hydrolase of the HAD superfamily
MPSAERLDAVTIDAAGTLIELVDPTERLRAALASRGVAREAGAVRSAFGREVAYYVPRSSTGRDRESLAALQRDAVGVFLDALAAELDAGEFATTFMSAIEFRPTDGAVKALRLLRSAGLALACVANWDVTLESHLVNAGLRVHFAAVVSSAESGAAKPDRAIFLDALERLGVVPERALHIGDSDADRDGALAARLAFEPTPLATLPQRLGLE